MSTPIPVWTGCVREDGRLSLDNRKGFDAAVRALTGQRIELTLRKRRQTRSSRANAYLWGVCYRVLSEHTGYEVDELHEVLAMRFLRIEDDPLTGAPRRKRTPKTNTAEFAAYVDQVIRFAAELGVVVPAPHDVEAA